MKTELDQHKTLLQPSDYQNIKNADNALELASDQFEAMFLQTLLKQMRQSSDVLSPEDSPFSSKSQSMYRDMHDMQLAQQLSKTNSLGIADMLVEQLSASPAFSQPLNKKEDW